MRLLLGAIAVTTLFSSPVWSQPSASETSTDWVIRRVEADGLQLGLTYGGGRGELRELGRLGRWAALPEDAGDLISVSISPTDERWIRLSNGDWSALLVGQPDGTALFLVAGDAEIGLAYPTSELGPALRGDWTRTQVHPSGPRQRQLRVSRDSVVLYDGLDRPTPVDARAARAEGGGPALVLDPDERGPALVRLDPVEGGFVALEVGADTFELVHAPEVELTWLDTEWGESTGSVGDAALQGLWLLGAGDGNDLRVALDFDTPPSWSRLGPDHSGVLSTQWSEPLLRLATDSGEVYHALPISAAWAVAWQDDDHYWTLRRTSPIDEALRGEWRVERADSFLAERAVLEASALVYPLWDERIPAAAVGGPETAQRLALTPDDRSGQLLRLRELGEHALISDDGDVWYRPGQRKRLAAALPTGDCGVWAEAARSRLRGCFEEACASDERACSAVEEVILPLRCTRQLRQRADRLISRDCEALWPPVSSAGRAR